LPDPWLSPVSLRYEFKGMVLTEEPLDTTIAALQPAAMDARTAAHRKGEFEVSVVDAFGRPVAATGVNMTLVRHHFVLGAAVAPEMVRKRFGDDVTRCAPKAVIRS
jgi:hypothetical protein